jgi:hypothetical protein
MNIYQPWFLFVATCCPWHLSADLCENWNVNQSHSSSPSPNPQHGWGAQYLRIDFGCDWKRKAGSVPNADIKEQSYQNRATKNRVIRRWKQIDSEQKVNFCEIGWIQPAFRHQIPKLYSRTQSKQLSPRKPCFVRKWKTTKAKNILWSWPAPTNFRYRSSPWRNEGPVGTVV